MGSCQREPTKTASPYYGLTSTFVTEQRVSSQNAPEAEAKLSGQSSEANSGVLISLEHGDRVRLRDGSICYVVAQQYDHPPRVEHILQFVDADFNHNGYLPLEDYSADLTCHEHECYDIVEVFKSVSVFTR